MDDLKMYLDNLESFWMILKMSGLCKNIAKGTTDPKVEFISQVQTQILIKFHLQNLDKASTSKSRPKFNFIREGFLKKWLF